MKKLSWKTSTADFVQQITDTKVASQKALAEAGVDENTLWVTLPPTRIRNHHLSRFSGVPATVIRDWRRRGFVPKTKHIDTRWIAVVIDVYATETSLKALFKGARRRHGLIRQRTRPDAAIEGERLADMMLPR